MIIPISIQNVLSFIHEKLGECPTIEDRSSTESWMWDGKTIASFWYGKGFLWSSFTGIMSQEERAKKYSIPFTEFDLLHEVCHWIVASPEQRKFPEFKLVLGHPMVDSNAWGTPYEGFRTDFGKDHEKIEDFWTRFHEDDVSFELMESRDEQSVQEVVTQMLSIDLGQKFSVSLKSKVLPLSIDSWGKYKKLKSKKDWKRPNGYSLPHWGERDNAWWKNNYTNYREACRRYWKLSRKLNLK